MLELVALLLAWIIALSAWLPIGYWVIQKLDANSELNPIQLFILASISGAACSSSLLGIVSLFAPVSALVSIAMGVGAMLLLRVTLIDSLKSFLIELKRWSALSWVGFAVLTIISIYTSLLPSLNNDSGLYYIQFMKWIQTYPAVPGLANLHERFGFNSNWHLLSAAYDLKTLGLPTTNDLNALLFVTLGLGFADSINLKTNSSTGVWMFGGIVLFLLLRFLTSTAPDLAATLIPVVYLTYLVTTKRKASLPLLILLVAFASTIKLLSVLHIVALAPIVYWVLNNRDYRSVLLAVVAGLVITAPWCARNVVQTGYLVFPLESIDLFSFDWKVPHEISENTRKMVTTHARMGTYDLETYNLPQSEWFSTWFGVQSKTVLAFFILSMVGSFGLVLTSAVAFLRKKSNPETLIHLSIGVTLIVSILFWWKSGPNPRFIYGIVLFTAIYTLTIVSELINVKKLARFVPLLALIPLALMVRTVSSEAPPKKPTEFGSFDAGKSTIFFPVNSDKCWDKELPCSNQYQPSLKLRTSHIKDGFRSGSD